MRRFTSHFLYGVFALCQLLSVHIDYSFADCVMYDVCHESPTVSNYCPVTNETRIPRPLPETDNHFYRQLAQRCPHLFADGNERLCCSGSQLESLFKGMSIPNSLFQRCPACLDNFWKNWCEYTCSPRQADFVKVLAVEVSPTSNLSYVSKVQYDISRDFADSMFSSCKDVQLASSSGTAMQLMCGRLRPNETCSVERWLTFMGTRSATLGVPIDIEYVYHNSSSTHSFMHVNTTRCDQAPRAGMSKCSRTDCPLVPIAHDFFPEDTGTQETCRLLGIGCTVYFLILAVLVFVTIFVCVVFTYCCRNENGSINRLRRAASESDWGPFGSVANWIPKQVEVNAGLFGEFITRQSYLTTLFGVFLAVVCCSGLAFLSVTTNPIDMWAPPGSRTIQERKYFDSHFGPFFRIQQIIMYPKKIPDNATQLGPIFEKEFFTEVFNVVNRVRNLVAFTPDGKRVTLHEICHRPMGPGFDCLINSPTNYFKHNVSLLDEIYFPPVEEASKNAEEDVFDYYDEPVEKTTAASVGKTYLDHLHDCIGNPYTVHSSFNRTCLGTYGGPTYPYLVFGGSEENDFMKSSAAVISILLSSKASMKKMLAWEQSFINTMKEYKHENVQLSFMAERSIQDEIQRESIADAYTVVIASLLMVVYVIFALGQYTVENNRLSTIFVHSKIIVGISGMVSIAAAVLSSIGVLSLYGMNVPSTAIVVQCFVTLFLGSNRMFLTVRAIQGQPTFPDEAMAERMYRVCSSVMPTMLICAVAQGVIFCVGAFNPVPAVRCFSLMAALSIAFQFLFHCTVFLPICVLDLKREEQGKPEIFCCEGYGTETPEPLEGGGYMEEVLNFLAPYLMSTPARIVIIGCTCLFFVLSPIAFPRIQLGLDQKMAVPEDSYMYVHFKNMDKYMNVGPPVYFVIQGDIDFSDKYWQDKMCTLGGCADDSVGAILAQAADNPKKTYLTGEVLNWIDSYIEWLSPANKCCKVTDLPGKPEYCPTNQAAVPGRHCKPCDKFNSDARPSKNIFYKHLKQFTEDVPNENCIQGGRAAFHDAIHLDPRGHVDSSYMMTFHVPLRNSSDFISAMEGARMVSRKIEHALNNTVKVFPYSVFYVFYDQFLTIRTESAYQLVFAMTGLFLSVLLLNGLDAWSAIIIVLTCLLHLITQVVLMACWSIEFNNISAVNLIMAVASSTEFTIPMVMAFLMSSEKTRVERAKSAFVTAGPTIFCGVTLTMLMGTVMLAFAHSQFFKVFFFRMLLVIGLSGAFCGLVFLPAVLSYWGPPSRKKIAAAPSCEIEHSSESRRLPRNALSRRGDGDHIDYASAKDVLDSLNPLLPSVSPSHSQPRLD